MKSKKWLSAIPVLLAYVFAITTATYAWFSMSNKTYAAGMDFTVSAPNNIQISKTGDPNDYSEKVEFSMSPTLGKIMPASSLTGFNGEMFETRYAEIDGSSSTLTSFSLAERPVNNGQDGYYYDIPLWMRTTGEADVDIALGLDADSDVITEVTPATPGGQLYKTVRVAFLQENQTANSAGGSEPFVFAAEGHDATKVVTAAVNGGAKTAPVYLDGTETLISLTKADITKSGNERYTPTKFMLRIWLEGEDSSCYTDNTFQTFNVSLRFVVK